MAGAQDFNGDQSINEEQTRTEEQTVNGEQTRNGEQNMNGDEKMDEGLEHDEGGPFRLIKTLTGHEKAVVSVKFSSSQTEGKFLVSASADKTAKIWDTESWKLVHTLIGHSKGVNDAAWSRCGRHIATASDDFTLRLWDAATGKCLRCMEGHTNYVFCCCFNPQGNMLVSGSYDETLKVWNVRDGRCMRSIPAHSDPLTSVDFAYDGTMILSSSYDGLVRLWDLETGRCLRTIIDEPNPPVAIARFTPNSRYLAIGTMDSRIDLWDYECQKKLKSYAGHQNTSNCVFLDFVSSSKPPLLVSGSEDGSIVFYDINTQQVVQKIKGRSSNEDAGNGHCDMVLAVSAHPTKSIIASGGLQADCTIKVWQSC